MSLGETRSLTSCSVLHCLSSLDSFLENSQADKASSKLTIPYTQSRVDGSCRVNK